MAKRILNANEPIETILPDECNQYLQSVDSADKFSNAPFDQAAWNHLCKMRRSKIATELKVYQGLKYETHMFVNFNNFNFFFKASKCKHFSQ